YVRKGGGLIWYMGDAVRPSFYNEKLFSPPGGLFPVRLGPAPVDLSRLTGSMSNLELSRDPLFNLFTRSAVPILDQVIINIAYPLAPESPDLPNIARDVQILARLSHEP